LNWEETIKFIRTQKDYKNLIEFGYFDEDLPLNIERFRSSPEFEETLKLLQRYAPDARTVLDIGSGNGISALALALKGYAVTVSEPDPSDTIGAGAIRKLKDIYNIESLDIFEDFAEDIGFPENNFDVVYVRQAMHHAYDLRKFIHNLSVVLKPGGLLLTIRDHVVYDEQDKKWFLVSHPLHGFYGGENAFTAEEYRSAMEESGLKVKLMLRHFDSIINYFPLTERDLQERVAHSETELQDMLKRKIPLVGGFPATKQLYKLIKGYDRKKLMNERSVPGRMYSFVAVKEI
jgi:SAM-dependent methyltransferase